VVVVVVRVSCAYVFAYILNACMLFMPLTLFWLH